MILMKDIRFLDRAPQRALCSMFWPVLFSFSVFKPGALQSIFFSVQSQRKTNWYFVPQTVTGTDPRGKKKKRT